MSDDSLDPLLVVSPHCDDGVLGCGALLEAHPGAVVVTVFAGGPPTHDRVTPWDAEAGFRPGDDVMAIRRAEDRMALALLDAFPLWLDFRDDQYGPSPAARAVAAALDAVVARTRPRTVAVPLGLFHADHHRTHAACLTVLGRRPDLAWLAYEDVNYRRIDGLLDRRLAALQARGVAAVPAGRALPGDPKAAAVRCYRSQLRAFTTPGRPGIADAFAAEGYWRLVP